MATYGEKKETAFEMLKRLDNEAFAVFTMTGEDIERTQYCETAFGNNQNEEGREIENQIEMLAAHVKLLENEYQLSPEEATELCLEMIERRDN